MTVYNPPPAPVVGVTSVTNSDGSLTISPTTGAVVASLNVVKDTEANILKLSPTGTRLAWATDLNQLMIGDGTNWWIDSSYLAKDLNQSDIGVVQGSNRSGYGQAYITDKIISNSAIGGNTTTQTGGLRYNATGLNSGPSIQVYINGAWANIVSNLNLQEVSAVLEHTPIGYTERISVFNGDSDALGLNGLPIVQGYKASMGCYPVQQIVYGGTF